MRAQQKGIVPLSQGYFPELRRNCMCLSTPIWVSSARKPKETARKSAAAQTTEPLQRWQAAVEVIISFTISLRGEQWSISVCGCCNVMIQETFCTFPNPSTNPQCPNSTLSGTEIMFSGRNSNLIGLFTFVCNGRYPLRAQWSLNTVTFWLGCHVKARPRPLKTEKLTKVSNSTWFLNWGSG